MRVGALSSIQSCDIGEQNPSRTFRALGCVESLPTSEKFNEGIGPVNVAVQVEGMQSLQKRKCYASKN
jgi:hypothetical protein